MRTHCTWHSPVLSMCSLHLLLATPYMMHGSAHLPCCLQPAGDEETPKADNNNGPSAYRLESIQSTTLPEDEPASTITSDNMPAIDGSAKDEATPTDGSAADKASLDKAPAEVSAAKPEFTTTKKETTSSGQQAVITQEDTTAEAAASTPQLTAGAQPLPKFRKGKEKWLKSKTLPYPDVFGIQHYPG
eukprot:GHRR01001987.1.p2 GENE.GHRR01001987.1~~GHRR01001987.1.p2  ORF type:complete len:188 (-),score=57.15 GHRR01001987.1:2820-3383(-)